MVVNQQEEIETNSDEVDVENAVTEAGFGKFNIKVAILGGLIYMNTGLGIGSVGFILPSAACDLQLSTLDKGRISATPILGMVVGSYFWGCLADVQGRRKALLYALIGYAIVEMISSVVTTYWIFLLLKFISGWFINGQSAIGFTYLGEFQSSRYREKILCWMEMAWTVGLVVLPLIGWGILPLKFTYVSGRFLFRSWNLFIFVCALPSLLIGFWLFIFPETPKYLAESGREEELMRTLETMHHENTGSDFDEYLSNLRKHGHERLQTRLLLAREAASGKIVETDFPTERKQSIINTPRQKGPLVVNLLRSIVIQSIKLWKPPHLLNTFTACAIMYCVGSSYYALMLWFPEVFERFAEFEKIRPHESASVCTISSGNWTETLQGNNSMPECPSTIQNDVYIQTLILGLSCLPVSIILPLCVHKLGYKFYLVISTTIASSITIGFFFVKSSMENLILSCIFEAFSSVCMSTMLCIVVDLFPTNLRAIAAALSILFARLGALVGNTLFGYLIDEYCISLIAIIAGQLVVAAALSLLLPGKSKKRGSLL